MNFKQDDFKNDFWKWIGLNDRKKVYEKDNYFIAIFG